ncbi:MAG: hypothetical protein ACI8X5_000384 [Planctomycetota bacterium]|jgi:hypothetical protein
MLFKTAFQSALVATSLLIIAPKAPCASVAMDSAILDLLTGRGILVDDSGIVPIDRRTGGTQIYGPGHLELAPGASAQLQVVGLGTLELWGPTSVSWQAVTTDGELRLNFGALYRAEILLRSSSARLELPGAWRVNLGVGAVSLRGLPGGGTELVNHAGGTASAAWIGALQHVASPTMIAQGHSRRLQGTGPAPTAPDRRSTPQARSWNESEWPWGAGPINGIPDMTSISTESWDASRWSLEGQEAEVEAWERWDWPWTGPPSESAELDVEEIEEHLNHPAKPESLSPLSQAPWKEWDWPFDEPKIDVEALPEEDTPAPEIATEAVPSEYLPKVRRDNSRRISTKDSDFGFAEDVPKGHQAEYWRGLPGEKIMWSTNYALQRSSDLVIDSMIEGRRRISLAANATEPVWFFNSQLDMRIFPGGSLVVEADGSMRYHVGFVRTLFRDLRR